MPRTVDDYLSLPFTLTLKWDRDDAIFVARVEELDGCSAHGSNESEALSNLRESMRVWIEDCIEAGTPVPEPPKETELPSGKWLQRVPRTLHFKLNRLARREGVSLNQLVASTLAEALGSRDAANQTYIVNEIQNQHAMHISYDWNQHANVIDPCGVHFANMVPVNSSRASAVYVQRLADAVEVFTSDVSRKERISYGQGPKQLVSHQS